MLKTVALVLMMNLVLIACSSKTTETSSNSLNEAAREGDTGKVRQILKNRVENKGGRDYKNDVIEAGHEI